MRVQKLYVCEICGTGYKDKKAAEECEARHKKVKIVDCRYLPYSQNTSGFPIKITVEDGNGKTAVYKR